MVYNACILTNVATRAYTNVYPKSKMERNVHSLALKPREHLWCKPYVHEQKKMGKALRHAPAFHKQCTIQTISTGRIVGRRVGQNFITFGRMSA